MKGSEAKMLGFMEGADKRVIVKLAMETIAPNKIIARENRHVSGKKEYTKAITKVLAKMPFTMPDKRNGFS